MARSEIEFVAKLITPTHGHFLTVDGPDHVLNLHSHSWNYLQSGKLPEALPRFISGENSTSTRGGLYEDPNHLYVLLRRTTTFEPYSTIIRITK